MLSEAHKTENNCLAGPINRIFCLSQEHGMNEEDKLGRACKFAPGFFRQAAKRARANMHGSSLANFRTPGCPGHVTPVASWVPFPAARLDV